MKTLYGFSAMIFAALIALPFASCVREGIEPCPVPVYEYDVYVVGDGFDISEFTTPLMWKNGEPEVLESKPIRPTLEIRNATVKGVWVYDNDVFAAGADYQDDGSLTIWKNGAKTVDILPIDAYETGQAISVYEGEVYIVSNEYVDSGNEMISIWKNGTPVTLSGSGYYLDLRYSLAVYNGSPYVVGNIFDESGKFVPRLWRNTEIVSGVGGAEDTRFEDVFVQDGNVYIAGIVGTGSDSRATLWVNGQAKTLSAEWSEATCVFVEDGKVYVGGMTYESQFEPRAVIWTDDEPVELPGEGSPSIIREIFVLDGNVYAVGTLDIFPTPFSPALWTNGELSRLPLLITPMGYATGVFAVRRPQ